jgi:AraC-like DNA-binding protein
MKTLTDLSIFQNRRAKQILREAHSIIYHDTSENPHEELKLDAVLPLGCEYFTYSHLREHKVFQRRINQQFFSIQYVHSGSFYIRSANKGFLLEPGDFIVLPPGQDNDLLFLPELGEYKGYGLIPNGPLLPVLLENFGLARGGVLTVQHPDKVKKLFQQLHRELLSPQWHTPEKISGTIYELLLLLRESVSACGIENSSAILVLKLREELENHMTEKISMATLAKKYNMSLPVLNRIFRQNMHQTPYQYLIRLRMETALRLLTENLRIKEIAARVGYADPLHFSAAFRKLYRCSPRAFRNNALSAAGKSGEEHPMP